MPSAVNQILATTVTATIRPLLSVIPAGGSGAARTIELQPAIRLDSPNGGETLTVGTATTIHWSTGALDHITSLVQSGTVFTADVSYDGGTTWVPTGLQSSTDTMTWTVSGPAIVGSSPITRARVRVRTVQESAADQSDADFTIVP